MIVWLASYPRSGNTLLRTMLYRHFGVRTFSLYDDHADIGADPKLAELVGHRSHGMKPQDFAAMASADTRRFFVKTHGPPDNGEDKAIYVVRDGRAAAVSYFHYNRDILKWHVSLTQVITGDAWAGSWSGNVRVWVFSDRPNTLVLRFEDMIARPAESLERIGEFITLPILERAGIEFSDLNAANPAFFRKGSNASNAAELDDASLRLFWSLHGETMVRLGYVDSIPA
jgi:hypothetical protein